MKHTAAVMLLVGIALFTAVLAWQGIDALVAAMTTAGWGLIAVVAWHLVPLVIDAHAWRLLFSRPRPSAGRIVWARWIGESVNGLLPVAQIGGDIAKARLLIKRGRPSAETGASVVVDTTLGAVSQMLFGIAGLLTLLAMVKSPDLAWALGFGIVSMMGLLAVFYHLQRRGLFGALAGVLQRIAGGRDWLDFVGGAQAMDAAIAACYARPGLVCRVLIWRLIGWFAGIGEVWLAAYCLGHPLGFDEALMLEALGQAVRGAAFAIPGALGVQEGGLALLATLAGLDMQTGLAISLIKRVRELAFGLPGLIAWQIAEGRMVFSRARRVRPGPQTL